MALSEIPRRPARDTWSAPAEGNILLVYLRDVFLPYVLLGHNRLIVCDEWGF